MSLDAVERPETAQRSHHGGQRRLSFANGLCAVYRPEARRALVVLDGAPELVFAEDGGPGRLRLERYPSGIELEPAVCALWAAFACRPATRSVVMPAAAVPLQRALLASGLAYEAEGIEETEVICDRATLAQHAGSFLASPAPLAPLAYQVSDGKRHPRRPPKREGLLYSRHVPEADTTVSFRTLSGEADLSLFHRWMNDPRVSAFWELEDTREAHARYLERVGQDPHNQGVFGCFDGEPFGYFELYFAKEDRVAPFYEAGDYDRGLHMLVGEQRFRGPARVAAWLSSLTHFLFLDDPRTARVVAEPRHDNARIIAYLERATYLREKIFDFPHKRAALMVTTRERFFQSGVL